MESFERTIGLIGNDNFKKLNHTTIAIFGIGGVGSYVFEALVRAGVGKLIIIDKDVVDITNINRQLIALNSTIGKPKVQVAYERGLDINPKVNIVPYEVFFLNDTKDQVDLDDCDYIVDAVDNVTAKLLLIELAKEKGIPIISCLGTGNKLDASKLKITEIEKTSCCPLAKVIRKELKERDIKKVKVLFSTEQPKINARPPKSISFVPAVAGLLIAGEVVREILGL